MRAAVVEELNKPLIVRNVADPECPRDGAIIRTGANGICRTDWHLWTGDWEWRGLAIKPPFVLGHEFSGTIEEVGSEGKGMEEGRPRDLSDESGRGNLRVVPERKSACLRLRGGASAGRVLLGSVRRICCDPSCRCESGSIARFHLFRRFREHGLPLHGRVSRCDGSGRRSRRRVGGGSWRGWRHGPICRADCRGSGSESDCGRYIGQCAQCGSPGRSRIRD